MVLIKNKNDLKKKKKLVRNYFFNIFKIMILFLFYIMVTFSHIPNSTSKNELHIETEFIIHKTPEEIKNITILRLF